MAQRDLNPSLNPTQDPDYLKQSKVSAAPDVTKPTGQANNTILPEGAKLQGNTYESKEGEYKGRAEGMAWQNAGQELAGLASLGDFAAKSADVVVKKDIDETTYTAVDRERQAYTAALEQTAGVKNHGLTGLSEGSPDQTVPSNVKSVGPVTQQLASARSDGKISNTYYYQRLNTIAKDMRSQYPGYRGYIDQEIAKVSGVHPANAYMAALTRDINSAQSAKAEKQSAVEKALIHQSSTGDLGALPLLADIQSGKRSEMDGYKYIAVENSTKYNIQKQQMVREDAIARKNYDRDLAKDEIIQTVTDTAYNVIKKADILNNVDSFEGLQKSFQDMMINPMKYKPEEIAVASSTVQALVQKIRTDTMASLNPKSVAAMGGPVEVKKHLDAAVAPYEELVTMVNNQQWGPAGAVKLATQSIKERATYGLLKDETIGPIVANINAMNGLAPDYAQKFFSTVITSTSNAQIATYMNKRVPQILTGTSNPALTGHNNPVSVGDGLREVESSTGVPGNDKKAITKSLVELPTKISDSKEPDQVKINLIQSTFSPSTYGIVQKFVKDGIDPVTNRKIPGGATVFKSWTSPAVTAEVDRLDKANPTLGLKEKYVDWAERVFSSEIFKNDVIDLNDVQLKPDMKIGWDNENDKFIVKVGKDINIIQTPTSNPNPMPRTLPTPLDRNDIARTKSSLDRINTGLEGIREIAKLQGKDVTTYLFENMVRMGYDPTKSTQNVPSKILEALIASKKKPAAQE